MVSRLSYGRYNWLGKVSLLIISAWLLIILLSINQMVRNSSTNSPEFEQNFYENNHFEKVDTDFEIIKQQNEDFRNIITW